MKQMNFREELAKLTPRLRDNNTGKIYIFGTGENWQNIHRWYKETVNVDLTDYVFAFVDNDSSKQGTVYMNRPVLSSSEIDIDNAVVLLSTNIYVFELDNQLKKMGLIYHSSYFYPFSFDHILKRFVYAETSKFSHTKNGRCFIVGNGPSLRADDLQKLHEAKEICFGVNKITKIFDYTDWRPTFYYCSDSYSYPTNEELKRLTCPKFLNLHLASSEIFSDSVYYFETDPSVLYYDYPYKMQFSGNIERVFVSGTVVMYELQGAVSMGFDEIYLFGCDNCTGLHVLHDGTVLYKNNKEHFYINDEKDTIPRGACVEVNIAAYTAAREYAEEHNINIRNATRGGALEVFERIDFDSLFQ